VDYDDFINSVARRAGASSEQARTITEATLETLADRISGGEANDLADRLPYQLADHLRKPPSREYAKAFGLGEFVQRVVHVWVGTVRWPLPASARCSPPCVRLSPATSSRTW
jgi:uncharacterized protein (DUF2267 family)